MVKGGGGLPDAGPREEYLVELSATGLGIKKDNTGSDQREKVGSASVSITKAHLQKSFISCTIEQLDITTGNTLMDMQAFAALIRRIQSLCIDNDAEHLATIGSETFRVPSGLLEPAGFTLCNCRHPPENVNVGAKSPQCMVLPARPIRSTVHKDKDHPMDSSPIRERDHVTVPTNGTPTRSIIHKDKDHPIDSLPTRERDHVTVPTNRTPPGSTVHKDKDHLMDSSSGRKRNHVSMPAKRTPIASTTNTGVPFGKKEYCMFWILRGECAYAQRGCNHKHEIPLDKETREKIGMNGIPYWFKESPHWVPWLQQVKHLELTRNGHANALSLAQPSGGSSDPRTKDVSSPRERKVQTGPRDRGNLGAYRIESPCQSPDQGTVASNIKPEGDCVSQASVTAIDSINTIIRTSNQRFNSRVHKHAGALEPHTVVNASINGQKRARTSGAVTFKRELEN